MRRIGIVLMIAVLIMFAGNISATIINVPANQPNIQAGIDASSNGDTVRVASGTYVENINFSGKNIVVGSWFLDAGDTSFISSTIIDGGALSSVVTFQNGEDNSAVITGFTIQNGSANGGGGIYCLNSSPTINNNTIIGNQAVAYSHGGGIYCNNSSPTIINNTISGNSAPYMGGGIYCSASNPTISNNTISGNSSEYNGGGGIFCYGNSNPAINYNTISGNSASDGGGISCMSSNPAISYNTISGNSAGRWGGGIRCFNSSSPTISNNTISGNSTSDGGGGICCEISNPAIINNTISGNSAPYGGGIECYYSSPVITNTIFWGNSAPNGPEIYLDNSSPVITYCDVQGGWAGETNIDCDPMFCYPDTGNYYLNAASCCVGAGEGGVDIGAFGVGCEAIWGYIAGTVTDDSDAPIESVYVEVSEAVILLSGLGKPEADVASKHVSSKESNDGFLLELVDSVYTDINGYYEVSVFSGSYDVSFSHDDYEDTIVTDVAITPGDTTLLNVEMVFSGYEYLPGDVNMANGLWPPAVIGGDVTYLVNYFKGSPSSQACLLDGFWCSADANGDCIVMGSDVIRLVAYFRGVGEIEYCADYEPAYPPIPDDAPAGWPNCEAPPVTGRVLPSDSGK